MSIICTCRYVPPAGPLAPYSFSEAAGRLLLRELEHGRFQGDGFIGCTPLVAAGSFAVVTRRYDSSGPREWFPSAACTN